MWEVRLVLSFYPLFQPEAGIRLPKLHSQHLQLNKFFYKKKSIYQNSLFSKDAPLEEGLSFSGWFLIHLTNIGLFKDQLALTYLLMTHCPPITLFSPASSFWMDRWHLGSLAAVFVYLESKLSFFVNDVYVFRIVFNMWVCDVCVLLAV